MAVNLIKDFATDTERKSRQVLRKKLKFEDFRQRIDKTAAAAIGRFIAMLETQRW
jgi:hypothetical protein